MEWIQVLTIVGSTIASCVYFRKETQAQMDKLADHGRERDQEMKEFHGNMCTLEERYIQMMKEQQEIRTLMWKQILDKKQQ